MRKIDTARTRELLDKYGDEAVELIEQLRPLLRDGRTSEALVTAATYLEAASTPDISPITAPR